jgi:hypothetical protein
MSDQDPTIEPEVIEPEVDEDALPVEEDASADAPTLLGFPLNRLIAFAGPYIAVISGVVADWLVVHVHILATFHVGDNDIAQAISQIIVFGVTAFVVWLGHQKWLDGYQQWAYRNAPAAQPVVDALHLPLDLRALQDSVPSQASYDPDAEAQALVAIDTDPTPEGAIGGKPSPLT